MAAGSICVAVHLMGAHVNQPMHHMESRYTARPHYNELILDYVKLRDRKDFYCSEITTINLIGYSLTVWPWKINLLIFEKLYTDLLRHSTAVSNCKAGKLCMYVRRTIHPIYLTLGEWGPKDMQCRLWNGQATPLR